LLKNQGKNKKRELKIQEKYKKNRGNSEKFKNSAKILKIRKSFKNSENSENSRKFSEF